MTGRRTKAPRNIDKAACASTGSTNGLPAWKRRDCPQCHARPGQSCVSEVRGRVQEVSPEGGAWYRTMRGPHPARRRRPEGEL